MNIKKIAKITLAPAAAAGIIVSGWTAVQAATGNSGSHPQAQAHRVDSRHAAASAHRAAAHRAAAHPAPAHRASAHRASHGKAHSTAGQARTGSGAHALAGLQSHASAARKAHAHAARKATSMFSGMSSFERCVAWRESGNNPTASSAGLFGILPATWSSLGFPGTAGQSSVAMQKAAFSKLYAQYGTSPWAPYDGC